MSDEAQGGQGEMKEIMENNLSLRDKCKCPFCGGTVINTGLDFLDRKSTRLNSSHIEESRMPSSA